MESEKRHDARPDGVVGVVALGPYRHEKRRLHTSQKERERGTGVGVSHETRGRVATEE